MYVDEMLLETLVESLVIGASMAKVVDDWVVDVGDCEFEV